MTEVAGASGLRARQALSIAVKPWLAVHALVALASAIVLLSHDGDFPRAGGAPDARGLFGWDAGWYRAIAAEGYDDLAPEAVRFFPLLPLAGRLLSPGGAYEGAALVVAASACALAYLATVAALAVALHGRREAATRSTWTAALLPGAAVLALPYTEALSGLLVAGFLLGLLRDRPALVAVTGFLSGLARPTGIFLAVPAVVAAVRGKNLARDLALATTPILGTCSYLAYSWWATGEPLAPFTRQSDPTLRGGLVVNPLPGVLADEDGGIGPLLTLTLMALGLALLVLAFRRLPIEWALWSTIVFVLSLSSVEAHSLPRYVAGIVPFSILIPLLVPAGLVWRLLLGSSAALSLVLTVAWLQGSVVP